MSFLGRKVDRERGQGLMEYALILVLVGVVVFMVLYTLGPTVADLFSNIVCGVKYGREAYVGGVEDAAPICVSVVRGDDGEIVDGDGDILGEF